MARLFMKNRRPTLRPPPTPLDCSAKVRSDFLSLLVRFISSSANELVFVFMQFCERTFRCLIGERNNRKTWFPKKKQLFSGAPVWGATASLNRCRTSGHAANVCNSMERAPLPARASQGEGPLQRWWVYQGAPELFWRNEFSLTGDDAS